jgi:DNA primase
MLFLRRNRRHLYLGHEDPRPRIFRCSQTARRPSRSNSPHPLTVRTSRSERTRKAVISHGNGTHLFPQPITKAHGSDLLPRKTQAPRRRHCFAPENGEALVANLKKQNVSLALAKELFLTDTDSNGGYFDKFRNRLMFPIRDEKGGLVGFGGRILGDGNPKYINSGETPLYSKSRILYGLNKAKAKMMKDRRAVLVEGYMDVIACHRAGITEAVASCGTALATDQARLLKRFVDKVTICYDADKAGQKAALKAIEIFREVGLPCRIAMLPQGEDPDTLLNLKGADAVKEAIESSQSPFDFEVWLLEENLGINSSDFWDEIPKLLAKAESELDLERHLLRIASQNPPANQKEGKSGTSNRHHQRVHFPTARRSHHLQSTARRTLPTLLLAICERRYNLPNTSGRTPSHRTCYRISRQCTEREPFALDIRFGR